jgi:hypothetical protein
MSLPGRRSSSRLGSGYNIAVRRRKVRSTSLCAFRHFLLKPCIGNAIDSRIRTMTAAFTTKEILTQFDECAAEFTFPMLDNGYVYLADVRLEAYRDEARWATIIEVIRFNIRAGAHDGINNCLHLFGKCSRRGLRHRRESPVSGRQRPRSLGPRFRADCHRASQGQGHRAGNRCPFHRRQRLAAWIERT